MSRYILAIDQSTQGTKGLLFDENGVLVSRADRPHRQIVNEKGWVEHDPEEILSCVLAAAREAVERAGVDKAGVAALGISNQRETVAAWDRESGKPLGNAIVWQCARARDICEELRGSAAMVKERTGLDLSPYFSAPKLAWMLRNRPAVSQAARRGTLCLGTMDSWLLFRLTRERAFLTDYSNASRTQLFHIRDLQWDGECCKLYGIPPAALAGVRMSDSLFGTTDLGGWLDRPIPIHAVLGDSHAALLGQRCRAPGQVKATYGTGSSVMMQTGERCVESAGGLVTSLAWGLDGRVEYVLEGNLNYTGAVISWLKKDMGLIAAEGESEELARAANPEDRTYFVPAFTGLGAPYWDSAATGLLTGVTRTTGRAEVVRACLACIAHQIDDLLERMAACSGLPVTELRVDGGPTANSWLMQFQSDIAGVELRLPDISELSGMGAAYAAGIAAGIYDPNTIYEHIRYRRYTGEMDAGERERRRAGWRQAVAQALAHG